MAATTLITLANLSDINLGSQVASSTPFTVAVYMPYLFVPLTVATTIILPQTIFTPGMPITIIDQGYAGRAQFPITIQSAATVLFNGQPNIKIQTLYGWAICVFDGANFEAKILP